MYLMVEGQPVALREGATRIGRSVAADICIEDSTVSRRHAIVMREGDTVRVLDDRSLNGLFVNGERTTGKTLVDGDVVSVGRHELLFEAPSKRAIAA
jgi:pSer/pThr/pTyr-binding forkhead associated (FHA) protein